MSKQFAAILAAIFIAFIGIFIVANHSNKTTTTSSVKPTNHLLGSTSSGVTLVEYADFQCPYCEQYSPTISAIQNEFKDRVQFQFRNFPLVRLHPNGFAASRAAEAASLQGKFWEMHDALYAPVNWQTWTIAPDPTVQFNAYAKQLGLQVDQFKKDFASSKVNDSINADSAAGTKIGVEGTPSFFLNGKQVTIPNSVVDFQKVLNNAIAKNKPAVTSTTNSTNKPVANTAN